MSYEVITPSAARAIFEAICWKPEIQWRVKEIAVLNPISFIHIKRCETAAMANVHKTEIIAQKCRQLRSSMLLRDVKYRITAEIILSNKYSVTNMKLREQELFKHQAMFRRRATKGQCFTQPYLGCREFSCDWRLVDSDEMLQPPILESLDLGRMLHDIDFSDPKHPRPKFFDAKLINGTLTVPEE